MVTRNSNWSTEILWYETGYATGKMLSPLKRPTWGKLHFWFCLKLLRICYIFPFLFFLSCSWIWHQWKIPTNISSSGVGKYHANPKNTILLTLMSVNIFAKNEFEEETFYVIFFLFILYYYLPFLDGKKEHCTIDFAFNNNRPQIEHIT